MNTKRKILYISILVLVALGAYGLNQALALDEGVYEVSTPNVNCANLYQATVTNPPGASLAELGPLFGFKYDANPTGNLTHTLTDEYPPWVVTNGPQDPYNSVSIFNVILSNGDGVQFDWSATLGIDAVIVKAQDSNVYVYVPEEFGAAGLVAPDGKSISHVEFCYDYELTATKTADAEFTRTYTWDITKDFDGEYWKFIGEAATSHDYDIVVDRTEADTDFKVTGSIIIKNPTPYTVGFSVQDYVAAGVPATVTCPTYSLAPNDGAPGGADKVTCTYSASLGAKTDGTNTATITSTNDDVGGATATDGYVFGDPTTVVGYPTVNVTDTFPYPGGDPEALGSASGDTTFDNDQDYACSSNPAAYTNGSYSYTKTNRAVITETGDYDEATVTVHCYAPVPSKDAFTSYTRTYTWDITKGEDGEYWKFIGDPAWSHDYDIVVDQTIEETLFKVYGTITVQNPNPQAAMTVSLADSVGGIAATLDCGGSLTVPAGGSATCGYSAFLATKTDGTNTATATLNSIDFPATAGYAFGDPTTVVGEDTVNVTDTFPYPGGTPEALGSASGDYTFDNDQELTCSSNPADYTNGSYSYTKTNRATITETGDYDEATVTVHCYAPVLDKDASTSWEKKYDWTITKGPDGTYEGFIGDPSFDHDYTVIVDQTITEHKFKVYGSIYVTNPTGSPGNMQVSLVDYLDAVTEATVDCGSGATSVTVAPGTTETCDYSGYLESKTDGTNTATGTFNMIDFITTEPYAFGDPTIKGYPTINVTDDDYGPLGSASGDKTFDPYSKEFQCPADKSLYTDGVYVMPQFVNTASIDEIPTENDSATVDLTCYAPVLTKDATATYDEIHSWSVEKTVNPESQGGFPGDILPWTWTVTVSESYTEDNFKVTGNIYVKNPAGSPGDMLVSLVDQLNDGTYATVDCDPVTPGNQASVTVAPGATGTCSYTAMPGGRTATKNTATGTFNSITFTAEKTFTFAKTVIKGTAIVTDTEIGLNEELTAGGGPWSFPGDDSHTCSSNRADYFMGDVYTQITQTITNWAYVHSGGVEQDKDDATTTWTCDASFVDLYKTTNGEPADPTKDISFALYSGTTNLEVVSTLNHGASLQFQTALVPGDSYTICEYPVPAGYTFEIMVNGGGVPTYAGPPGEANPTGEIQCFDFTAEPAGTTVTFNVNNRYPGGAPRTPGYWKNWNRCTGGNQAETADKLNDYLGPWEGAGVFLLDDLLPQTIGSFSIMTCEDGVKILDARDLSGKKMANDAAYTLARALLAARLNQDAGACVPTQTWEYKGEDLTFEQILTAADALLTSIGFNGTGSFLGPKVKNGLIQTRADALYLYGIIDGYNNSMFCTGEPSH